MSLLFLLSVDAEVDVFMSHHKEPVPIICTARAIEPIANLARVGSPTLRESRVTCSHGGFPSDPYQNASRAPSHVRACLQLLGGCQGKAVGASNAHAAASASIARLAVQAIRLAGRPQRPLLSCIHKGGSSSMALSVPARSHFAGGAARMLCPRRPRHRF